MDYQVRDISNELMIGRRCIEEDFCLARLKKILGLVKDNVDKIQG